MVSNGAVSIVVLWNPGHWTPQRIQRAAWGRITVILHEISGLDNFRTLKTLVKTVEFIPVTEGTCHENLKCSKRCINHCCGIRWHLLLVNSGG
uniref:Uncharacterized protein n=1 Tax=Magnetococcus massalia (strain MO-1) TaxID=451514 RepID=A0A1S7LGJ3_MAGMO|nr:protein of unknown function [Candidatus Magnetococcus massalia]